MSDGALSIVFYRAGERSAPAFFPGSLEEGLAMLKRIAAGETATGIDAEAVELRRGEEIIRFVSLPGEDLWGRTGSEPYSELWERGEGGLPEKNSCD